VKKGSAVLSMLLVFIIFICGRNSLKGTDHLEDLRIDRRKTLKQIFDK
jgi:hypothetical protein